MRTASMFFRFGFFILTLLCISQKTISQSLFHGDSLHTGFYSTEELKQPPIVKWQYKTNGKVFSSPALWNNTVYIGSGDSCLYAIDAANGTQRWKYRTTGRINSSPAVYNERVYFGSYDGHFYALDAVTGDTCWTFLTNGEYHFQKRGLFGWQPGTMLMEDVFDFYTSSPIVYNGNVYFGCGDSTLYALDAQSGQLKWTFKTGGVIHSSPAACHGKILCGSWDRNMYCLNAETGEKIWHFTTGADPTWLMAGIIASPAISNNTVFFGARDAQFYAIDLTTGLKKWSVGMGGAWIQATAAIIDSTVYVGTSDNTLICALNTRTGSVVSSNIDAKTYVYSSPIVTDSMIYYGTFAGAIHAADRRTRNELWKFQTDASKQNSPLILANGRINWNTLCPGMDLSQYSTNVFGVEKLLTMGSILSSPVLHNGTLFFGSADSCIYALSSTGTNSIDNPRGDSSPQLIPAELHANYPNPFNPSTKIQFRILKSGIVTIIVTDVLGRKVNSLMNDFKTPGTYTVQWDGKDAHGERISSGVYYCTLQTAYFQRSIKMILLQ